MERQSSKWIATAASIWIQCGCGAYTFSIFSAVLKSSQGYDQSTLDIVSVVKDVGGNAGVLAGVLYSAVALSNRRSSNCFGVGGPWVVHLAGAIQNFVGYFLMWASVVGLIQRPPVPLMCCFVFLATHAQTFFTTANVVSGVHNFPHCGGTVVGTMKGFLGLGGAIVIQVYETFFEGRPSTFLLMLALFPTFISLALMFLVRIDTANRGGDKKHLTGFTAVALLIAGYLMIIIILENIFTLPFWARTFALVLLLLLLVSPLGIAINAQREDSKLFPQTFSVESNHFLEIPGSMMSSEGSTVKDPLAYHELPGGQGQLNAALGNRILPEEEGMNLLQAMCSINFWLLFIAMVCGMGSGVAVINNFSQIGESLNYSTVEIDNLVSLWCIWNFLGRIGAGYLSDFLLHTRGCARPFLMATTLAAMAAGYFVLAFGFPGILYVGSIVVGICYGSQWSLMPAITSEIFGVRHRGTIFNAIGIASPVGSYIFSVRIMGQIYDKEAGAGDDSFCFGTRCFMVSFLIMSSMTFLGFLVALALFFRTRRFYKQVVIRRLKHSLK